MTDGEADLRALLGTLDPKPRDTLRRVLIRDQGDRDAIASQLMRYRDENGQRWAREEAEHEHIAKEASRGSREDRSKRGRRSLVARIFRR